MTTTTSVSSASFIGFDSVEAAKQQRDQHGGWIFIADDASCAIWYSSAFTPSKILTHPAGQGLSGRLV
jgi:hypothetical protein